MELHIKKVVLGDRGDYRLEVKAKDVCDSCGFNIDVEGPLAGARRPCGFEVWADVERGRAVDGGRGSRFRGGTFRTREAIRRRRFWRLNVGRSRFKE